VNLLIKRYKMPVNRQNEDGDTPLAVGVKSGNYDVVCALLDHGANPNIPNLRAETPLHIAACFGYEDISKELIKYGGWIDAEDDCGDTPLHWAVREEQLAIVGLLLRLGADPHHVNEDDESPINLVENVGSDALVNAFDSIAGSTNGLNETGFDGVSDVFSYMNSNCFKISRGSSKDDSNSMEIELGNSDIDVDINSSGTVHPTSFGKDDEYMHSSAGKEGQNRNINFNDNRVFIV